MRKSFSIAFRYIVVFCFLSVSGNAFCGSPNVRVTKMTPKEAEHLLTKDVISDEECFKYVEALDVLAHDNSYKSQMPNYCSLALQHYGWMLIHNRQLEMAQQILEKSLSYTAPSDSVRYYSILSDMGHCYLKAEEYTKARQVLDKLLVYYKKVGDKDRLMVTIRNMGVYYYHLNQSAKALECFLKSNKMASQVKDWFWYCAIICDMAPLLDNVNNRIQLLKSSLSVEQEHDLSSLVPFTHYHLSKAYLDCGQYDQALKEADISLDGQSRGSYSIDSSDVVRLIGDIYNARQNFELGSYYYKMYSNLLQQALTKNKIWIAQQSETMNSIVSWCDNHVTKKKDGTFEFKDDEDLVSSYFLIAFVVMVVVALFCLVLIFFFRRQRSRLEARFKAYQDSQTEKMEGMEKTIGYLLLFYNNQNVLLSKLYSLIKQIKGSDSENDIKLRNLSHFIQTNRLSPIESKYTKNEHERSEQFLERLVKLYPNLTETDKQMALYLWYGLSTHEICILTGNQLRSVNMSRYRLRKSMSIDGDFDLIDVLRSV